MESKSGAPARRRKPPQQRRNEIVRAAARLIIEDGVRSLTIRRVAEQLDVFPGLVSHYFASVNDLVVAGFACAVSDETDAWFAAAMTDHSPIGQMRNLLDPCWFGPPRDVGAFWVDTWNAAKTWPELRNEVIRQMEIGQVRLAEIIEQGIAAGQFVTDDPRLAATRILAVVDALIVQSVLGIEHDLAVVAELVLDTAARELDQPAIAAADQG